MAVIKYSGIITELIGKLGGVVFQRCGQSLSVRSNPSHLKVSNEFGQRSRQDMSVISSAWRSLNSTQREQWSLQASTYPTLDKFGNPIILTGYQLFVYVNKSLYMVFGSVMLPANPYAPPSLIGALIDSVSVGSSEILVSSVDPLPSYSTIALFISKPMPLGALRQDWQTYYVNQFPSTWPTQFNVFPIVDGSIRQSLVVGQTYAFELWQFNSFTGQFVRENLQVIEITS